MSPKCVRCGRELSSIFEKNSGICDSCMNNPGGSVGFRMSFDSCSKCGGPLISFEEQKSGICYNCKISGRSKFSF